MTDISKSPFAVPLPAVNVGSRVSVDAPQHHHPTTVWGDWGVSYECNKMCAGTTWQDWLPLLQVLNPAKVLCITSRI